MNYSKIIELTVTAIKIVITWVFRISVVNESKTRRTIRTDNDHTYKYF